MEVLGGLAALLTRTPWILGERSTADAYPSGAKNWLRVRVGRRAAAIVSNSSVGDHYWRSRAGSGVKRFVIPNGLPLDEIDAAPPAAEPQIGAPVEAPVVLYAGRLSPEKNVETLIRALRLVADMRPARSIVCGAGPSGDRLSGLIAELGLAEQVRLVGYVSQLWSLMKCANVLVSVSFFEGSPNVVLEAMACGCPLIVSEIPAHRELLDDSMAIFVDPSRPNDLADAIASVLTDPAGAATRAQAARARVQAFGLPFVARRYADVYRTVANPAAH
jgi:glycosyltransferase involved in cell wall biosynthesis